MKVHLQRVSRAAVRVDGATVGAIDRGLLVLLGVERADRAEDIAWYAKKTAELRIFPDDEGKMNRGLLEAGGEALVVSQFTLSARTRKGKRPSFADAAPPEVARDHYERFCEALRELGVPVETGTFQAMMEVEMVNDGPVTILLEPR